MHGTCSLPTVVITSDHVCLHASAVEVSCINTGRRCSRATYYRLRCCVLVLLQCITALEQVFPVRQLQRTLRAKSNFRVLEERSLEDSTVDTCFPSGTTSLSRQRLSAHMCCRYSRECGALRFWALIRCIASDGHKVDGVRICSFACRSLCNWQSVAARLSLSGGTSDIAPLPSSLEQQFSDDFADARAPPPHVAFFHKRVCLCRSQKKASAVIGATLQ